MSQLHLVLIVISGIRDSGWIRFRLHIKVSKVEKGRDWIKIMRFRYFLILGFIRLNIGFGFVSAPNHFKKN